MIAPTAIPKPQNLRLGLLTFVPSDRPQRPVLDRLEAALNQHEAVGEVQRLHHGELFPKLASGKDSIQAFEEGGLKPLTDLAAVLVRWEGAPCSDQELYLLRMLAARIPVINPPETSLTLRNKFTALVEAQRAGLPIPKTVLLRRSEPLAELATAVGGYPLIAKRVHGARGKGVMLIKDEQALRAFIDFVWTLDRNEPILLQQFFAGINKRGSGVEDIRVWVAGGDVLRDKKGEPVAARRIPAPGEFRANADLGAEWEPTNPSAYEIEIAVRSLAVFGAEYMGVDIMRTPAGPYILDLNSNAEFRHFQQATGVDVAARIADTVVRRVALHRWKSEEGSAPTQRPSSGAQPDGREALLEGLLYKMHSSATYTAPQRVGRWLDRLGHPEREFQRITVVGTNGKGSTCAYLERMARAAGLKTGLFTSPHMFNFEERIRINGCALDAEQTPSLAREALRIARDGADKASWMEPSGFDLFLLMAVIHFAHEGVDVGIFEAGVGGRYDPTRAVKGQRVGLTSIDLEHTNLLGRTEGDILAEKLAMTQPGSELFISAGFPHHEIVQELEKRHRYAIRYFNPHPRDLHFEADGPGPFSSDNLNLAEEIFRDMAEEEFPQIVGEQQIDTAIDTAVQETRWPGRMTRLSEEPLIITDAAHTPAAVIRLAHFMADMHSDRRCVLLLATAETKCRANIIVPLAEIADQIVITEATYRAADANQVAKVVQDAGLGECIHAVESDFAKALGAARDLLTPESHDYLFAAGGLFLAADMLQAFGEDLKQL